MPTVYSRKRLRAQQPHLTSSPSASPLSSPESKPTPKLPIASSSRRTPRPTRPQPPRKRRRFVQTHLDLGQQLGPARCAHCNLVYTPGTSDTVLHARLHASTPTGLRASRWAGARRVGNHPHGDIRCITGTDPSRLRSAAIAADHAVAVLLSTASISSSVTHATTSHPDAPFGVAVALISCGLVRAFVRADVAHCARRTIVAADGIATVPSSAPIVRGTMCAIVRIWVHRDVRRSGVASKLVDVAREELVYGGCIARERVAFTPTTIAGARFASAYCCDNGFLVCGVDRPNAIIQSAMTREVESACAESDTESVDCRGGLAHKFGDGVVHETEVDRVLGKVRGQREAVTDISESATKVWSPEAEDKQDCDDAVDSTRGVITEEGDSLRCAKSTYRKMAVSD